MKNNTLWMVTVSLLAMNSMVWAQTGGAPVAGKAPAVTSPAQGGLEDAATALKRGNASRALEIYKQIINASDEGQRAQARLGAAYALDHLGNDEEGLRILEGTVADNSPLGQAIGEARARLLLQLAAKDVATGDMAGAGNWLNQYDRLTVQPDKERATRLRRRVEAAQGQDKVGVDLPPLKIGVLLPLSGRLKATGEEILRGMQLGLEKQPGDRANALVLAPFDTAAGADAAANAAIAAGAAVIAGPLLGSDVASVTAVAHEAKVPVISFTSDRSVLTAGVTSIGYLPTQQARAVADWAAGEGYAKVAALVPSSAYGNAVSDAFGDAAAKDGMTLVASSFYNPANVDLSASVRQLVGGKPISNTVPPFEAIFAPAPTQSLPLVTSQLDYYDLDKAGVQLLGTGLWQNNDLLKPSAQGVRGAVFAVPPKADSVADAYTQAFGEAPLTGGAILGYDLAWVLGEAAAELRVNGMGVAETLVRPEGFYAAGGYVKFLPDGNAMRGLNVVRIQGDGFHVIRPALDQVPLAVPENLTPHTDGRGWRSW